MSKNREDRKSRERKKKEEEVKRFDYKKKDVLIAFAVFIDNYLVSLFYFQVAEAFNKIISHFFMKRCSLFLFWAIFFLLSLKHG